MRRRYLSLILPAVATLVPAYARPPLLSVADIPATLAATGGDPATWVTPDVLRDMYPAYAAHQGMPLAAWVSSASLVDSTLQAEVRTLLEQGAAVLVTSRPGEARHELATFGVEPTGRNAIYRQSAEGFSVTSVTADIDEVGAAEAWQQATAAVLSAMLPSADPALSPEHDAPTSADDGRGDRAFLRIDEQSFARHGRSASQTIRIMRDTTASHDYKVIAVEATVNVLPYANGLLMRRDDEYLTPYFVPDGEGFHLYVPNAYHSTTVLQWRGESPNARLLQAVPRTSGVTNRKITEEISSKSTFTASVSPDVQSGLNKDGVSAQGKVPFSLAWASEASQRSVVEMSVDDYAVSATAKTHPWGIASTWTFPLAADISGNPDYFGEKKLSTKKMTQMMRRASLATASEWRVDGNYEQTVLIASRGTVENRYFMWSGIRNDPKRRPYVRLDKTSRDPFQIEENGLPWEENFDRSNDEGADLQPWVASKIDLSSPFLTRSPTILIQSLAALGDCLQAGDTSVDLAVCDKGMRSQQWNLEADSTYRNRANGACLTTDARDGSIGTAPCESHALNQQWKWSADRIHSMYEGGETWRLHVHEGLLNAKFDASRQQPIAPNPNHFLLRPWSSYPSPPSEGDWVPSLSGRQPPFQRIPDLVYGYVETTERWQTVPLRHGL